MGQSVATRFPAPINAWRQGVGRPLVITRAEDLLPRKPFTTPAALSLVAASTGIMLVLRLALGPWVGDRLAFTPFLVSTAGATFWLGWRWGVATALVGALLAIWMFGAEPLGWSMDTAEAWSLGVYGFMAAIVICALQLARWSLVSLRRERVVAEQLEMVSHELSHRIQNIFAITTSLARLSAHDHPAARDYADALLSRLDALARAHNFIRPHSPASTPEGDATLRSLLATLFAPYQDDGLGRLDILGDDVAIGAQAATPLALLFHELATNSVKYGALSTPGGRVAIDCAQLGDRLRVTWTETGGPAIDGAPARTGFGTRLATMSVEKQLRGALAYDWPAQGLAVRLSLPLSSLC